RNKKSSTIRTLGEHPNSGETLVVKDGRYGPYISDGKVNASLNKTVDPETVTLEEATELIDEKRAKGPIKKRRKKR
ncbi:MAG: topoisomerase C-terminal repeat-containing protein, partial [Candidatus Neomarinimicrobiota bacterium]|nr:topoisomerase C-terminal repeat-containing protein [Candidatus Neomarinimicrobiota bacterium]